MATGVLAVSMDAADRLILDEAAGLLAGSVVAVIDAPEVGIQLKDHVGELRVGLDSAGARARFAGDTRPAPIDEAIAGADLVLLRLPKSLDQLDDLARVIARTAQPTVTLVAGGRLKYLSLGMNEVLARSFGEVRASLARQKSRVLFASSPRAIAARETRRTFHEDLGLWVAARGGVFAGASVDIGTRAMLASFDSLPDFTTAIDLGCGTGILAAELKRRRLDATVIGSDDSELATTSARETMAANALDVEIRHEDALAGSPDGSIDLIVLNPPFHDGGSVSTDAALAMFRAAARVLKSGGELRTVWNSHLGYRGVLANLVGPTSEIFRNEKFTVTRSIKTSDKLSRSDSVTN